MRTNSKNTTKRRNSMTMTWRTLRKNILLRSKKSKEDMKAKTESYKTRLMNSKIMVKNLKTDSNKENKISLLNNKNMILLISWWGPGNPGVLGPGNPRVLVGHLKIRGKKEIIAIAENRLKRLISQSWVEIVNSQILKPRPSVIRLTIMFHPHFKLIRN